MGSGRNLKISATGFPGTNQTWRFIQQAWREPLEAFARLTGDKVIVSGAVITPGSPTTVSNGFISYQGEIIPFVGGNLQNNITLIKTVETVAYDVDIDEDGNQDILPAYESKHFQFGTGGEVTFPFTDLIRLKTIKELSQFQLPEGIVIDPNYFAFTANMYNHLMSLQTNEQADWNTTNVASGSFIKNKPTNFLKHITTVYLAVADIPTGGTSVTVNIPQQPNTSYLVLASLETSSDVDGQATANASVGLNIYDKKVSSFKVRLREWTSGSQQNLKLRASVFTH